MPQPWLNPGVGMLVRALIGTCLPVSPIARGHETYDQVVGHVIHGIAVLDWAPVS